MQAELRVSHNSARKAGEALQMAELIVRQGDTWAVSSGLLREWLTREEE